MIRTSLVFITALALPLVACKKGQKGDKADTAEKSAKPAAATKLPKVGLQLDVPGTVTVDDAIGGEGNMLMGGAIGAMQVTVAKTAQTLDEAKSESEMYNPKNVKGEALPDGWTLTYDNKGSMGANFFVKVRRDINAMTFECSSTTDTAARQAAIVTACKSLRP